MTGREIIVGVCGGVAAYKTAALVSRLVQDGAGVSVVVTESAQRFVGITTFQALTGRPVACELFDPRRFHLGAHIELSRGAELLCVAPATANLLAKAACGLADDLLSTLLLAFDGPVILAPAMNGQMWEKPAVVRNVRVLREDGYQVLDPEPGWLSCRQQAIGRMQEPEAIATAIADLLPRERKAAP